MKYIKKMLLLVLGLLLTLPFIGSAQKLVLEKTYQVDKKAKKGYLDNVIVNPSDNTTTLSFVTKSKGSKVNYQNYIFDKEYNFLKMETKEDEYTGKTYKGEKYSTEGITLEPAMLGGFSIKKKRTEYSWNWLTLSYTWQTTLLDKIKVKDENGNKYWLVRQFENTETNEIYALVMGKGPSGQLDEYSMIKVGQDLKFEVIEKFAFAKTKGYRASFTLPTGELDESGYIDIENTDITNSDICFIFGAISTPDASKLGDHRDFEMIRISNKGKVQSRAEFKVEASEWNINSVTASNGSLYLVGPANTGKPLKSSGGVSASVTFGSNPKFDFYQVAKLTGDKADYCKATNLDAFEAKLKKPASQKKSPEYKGKKFTIRNTAVTKDGSLFVYGQNFNNDGKWEDILMFYFDNTGVLKAQYGVRLEEKNDFTKLNMARQYMTVTDNYAYWEVWELSDIDSDGRSFRYPNIAKINLSTGDIGEFQKFGTVKGDPTYFLQNKFPCIRNPADNSLIYLGVNKKGNEFWFGKIVNE